VTRFYFDVWVGEHATRDETGLPLASLSAAEDEAIKAAAGIGQDSLPRSRATETVVQVRDDHDYPVLTVALAMSVCRMELAHV
jgi:hypothetical protein